MVCANCFDLIEVLVVYNTQIYHQVSCTHILRIVLERVVEERRLELFKEDIHIGLLAD